MCSRGFKLLDSEIDVRASWKISQHNRTIAFCFINARLNYLSVRDFNYSSALRSDLGIMRNYKHGLVLFAVHFDEQVHNLSSRLFVEISRRLVAEENLRIVYHSACYRYALLLTTRKLRGIMVDALRNPEAVNDLLIIIRGLLCKARGEQYVFGGGELGQQIEKLKHKSNVI